MKAKELRCVGTQMLSESAHNDLIKYLDAQITSDQKMRRVEISIAQFLEAIDELHELSIEERIMLEKKLVGIITYI